MSVALYMDVHVRGSITAGLRRRGVNVLTAQDDGADALPDDQLLERATRLARALFSQDDDLLREAARRQQEGVEFAGVVYGHQLRITVGQAIHDLELISQVFDPEDIRNRIEFLPL